MKINKKIKSKYRIWLLLLHCLFALIAGNTYCQLNNTYGQYTVPTAVWSVSAADLNLDGDVDIVTGHNYDSQTLWSGISIVANLGNGIFELTDSIYFYGGQNVKTGQLNLDPHPEIIFKKVNSSTEFIGIIYDNIYNDTVFINMNSYEGIDKMELGDVDGNGYNDIVFSVLGEIRW